MHRSERSLFSARPGLWVLLGMLSQACGGTSTGEMPMIELGTESLEWISPPMDDRLWGTRDVLVIDGSTWALTSSEPFLHVFRGGVRVGTFGRSGGGPTEMRAPKALLVGSGAGEVTVWDPGSEKYLAYPSFSKSEFRPTVTAAPRLGGLIRSEIDRVTFGDPYRIAFGIGHRFAASYRDGVMGGGDLWSGQLHRFSRIHEKDEPWIDFAQLPGAAEVTRRDAVLGAVPLWDACSDGRIALLDPIGKMVYLIVSDWEDRDSIPLAWQSRPLHRSERIGYLVAQFRNEVGDSNLSDEEIASEVAGLERDARHMFSMDAPLGVDLKCGAGRVWVQEFDGGTDPLGFGPVWRTVSVDARHPSGIRVTFPADFTLHRVLGSDILGVMTDSLGLERIAKISLPPALRTGF